MGPVNPGVAFLSVRFIVREFHPHVLCVSPVIIRILGKKITETFSLRPSWGASTVMNKPLIPRLSAYCTSFLVIFLSLFTYLGVVSIDYTKNAVSAAQLVELYLSGS